MKGTQLAWWVSKLTVITYHYQFLKFTLNALKSENVNNKSIRAGLSAVTRLSVTDSNQLQAVGMQRQR